MPYVACIATLILVAGAPSVQANDVDYEPPVAYYSAAAGLTGSALQTQLRTIMSAGFIGRNYGDNRFADAVLDADPNVPGNILLIYNRASVSATWDGGATWNREHQWPVSLLGTSDPSNTQTDMRTDEFLLRPCNPGVNSSRSNSPYGTATSSGTNGYKTPGFYYPGDADRGDAARAMFYAVTRYPTYNGHSLSLVNGSPGTYQMGDLNSLLHWNYTDTPDAFERRRNQAVYSSALNPSYYQNNRNAFIDHPEYVWSVFVDQANDSQLTTNVGSVNLGRIIAGSAFGTQSLTINKSGVDGTYYSVTTAGSATSTVSGRFNAFAMDAAGSKAVTAGLNASTATAGLKSGSITVDNLDITTAGGAGKGANDADDVVTVSGLVLDHASPSFSGTNPSSSIALDFGTVTQHSGTHWLSFDLFNRIQTAGYTARLDLDLVGYAGSSAFTSTLGALSNLDAGSSHQFSVWLNASTVGEFFGTYSLLCSDENIAGAQSFSPLTLTVTGTVAIPEPMLLSTAVVASCMLLAGRPRRRRVREIA
jgi:endonuclease I